MKWSTGTTRLFTCLYESLLESFDPCVIAVDSVLSHEQDFPFLFLNGKAINKNICQKEGYFSVSN